MQKILFNHAHLVIDGNREYLDGALLVEKDTIKEVYSNSNSVKDSIENCVEINLEGKIVMPGFFDSHSHGAYNVSYNSASLTDIDKVSEIYAKHGTTSFFTTLTSNEKLIDELQLLENTNTKYARHLGIHLEGPFISKKSAGVIDKNYIYDVDEDLYKEILNSSSKIKQMTLAPELDNSKSLIDELVKRNIKVMFGHSLALKEDVVDKYNDGYTHLMNAMSGFHHRNIGLVNMAFIEDDKYAEVIADGFHIDIDTLKVILKNIRRDRLIVISDSIKVAGIDDCEFEFEGETCIKKGFTSIRKSDGRIAGNAGFIADEIKVIRKIGTSLTDILLMSSLNAYRLYGLDKRFGTLAKGKCADIVIMDEDLNILKTYVKGQLLDA